MKRYDKYKQTGTPWIGKIPTHWKSKRLRFVCSYQKGKNPKFLSFDKEEGMIPYLSMEYLRGAESNVQYTNVEEGLVTVSKNDILLLWDGSNAGEFIMSLDGVLSSTCAKLLVKESYKKYFAYYCFSIEKYLQDMTNGMGIPHVDSNILKNITALIPPIVEQEAIARYLDKKCGSIDAVISTQERRIALLEELKQSVITEAVTHGVTPNAKLRPSGIDWIGNIPQHWEVMPLKRTGCFGNGLTYSPEDICGDEGVLVLRSSNINGDKIVYDDNVYVRHCPEDLLVKRGDIIICSRNGSASLVGKCGIVEKEESATFGAFMMRYIPKYKSQYSFFLLQAALKMYKGLYSTTTINQLTKGVIDQIYVPIASDNEQIEISEYIENKCSSIDASIAKAKREIELLKELKQSVITEAVTGKIKVY